MLIFKTGDIGFITRTTIPRRAGREAVQARHRIEDITATCNAEPLLTQWRALLLAASSPEKIYQTPEYVAFLKQTAERGQEVQVFAVVEQDSQQVVGIVPVRLREQQIDFGAGARIFAKPRIKVVSLLGSVALMPADPGLLAQLFSYLLDCFRDRDAISMQSVPAGAEQRRLIENAAELKPLGYPYVLFGWRQCHTIPLHPGFEAYLGQMSAKKRYNLKRQLKQLAQHAGSLRLERITEPSHVPLLMSSVAALAPASVYPGTGSARKYEVLAEQGLLHSYVLQTSAGPAAVIMGTRSNTTLHVHNVYHAQALERFSVGTSILYLAIEDLSNHFQFAGIDLGYGAPAHSHESTNVQMERGHLLYLRRTLKNLLLSRAHGLFVGMIALTKAAIAKAGEAKLRLRSGAA